MSFYLVLNFTRQTIKEDKTLIYEDWKENILPLLASGQLDHDQKSFGVEQYFAAKSLVSSRSFEIDEYHGYGMVPLADLFNHKTGAENVHFTRSSDSDSDGGSDVEDIQDDDHDGSYDSSTVEDVDFNINGSSEDDPTTLEMIVVKSVKAGNEVYNTYGTMGNAALLHRYGFTELDNGFDIVNIDLKLVLKWSSSLLSGRQSRARLSLWRRLGCVGCISGNSEYFEISSDGEPQLELLILIYIISLSEKTYDKLNHKVQTVVEDINKAISILLLENNKKRVAKKSPEMGKDLLLTQKVRDALVSIADFRESSYGTNLIIEDIETLEKSSPVKNRKLYHSLVLRVSERRILEKLRTYSSNGSSKRSKKKPFLK